MPGTGSSQKVTITRMFAINANSAFGFTDELPYMGCAWWILGLFLALLIVGMLYLLILDGLKKVFHTNNN